MSNELAIEILKQATLETTTGACETCPRKDKNKTCIGCLDEAKENILNQLQQKENIIKEVREYIENNTEEKKSWLNGIPDYRVFKGDTKELLEILEKVD